MVNVRWRRRSAPLGSTADRAAFQTLHTATLMTGALRGGLSAGSAGQSVRHLRSLLPASAAALTDTEYLLAWDGIGGQAHAAGAAELARRALADGGTTVHDHRSFACEGTACSLRKVVLSPLVVQDAVVGTLQVFAERTSASLVQATTEVAAWISSQLELAERDTSRTRLMEAEVRAMRAQISPHFVYNALNAIASFVRTDPDRARELLLDFADFSRHSLQRLGEYTTLEEELRHIERYLVLEQARFGDRLRVTLLIAPEVLPVTVPVLSLQPLVENAVRHGIAGKIDGGHITINAVDQAREAVISIEDDGVGEDPERVRRALAGDVSMDSIGLGNVDARLRTAYGDEYGLVVETAPGAGTKVTLRVPKFAVGVRP